MLVPRFDILPTPQRSLWPELAAVPAGFVLYGGTALALRLAHRSLCYFGDGDLPSLPVVVRERLTAAASGVDIVRLPEVPALPGGLLP